MSLAESLVRASPGRFGMWASVWKLLRLRIRLWYNGFRRSKLRNKIGVLVLVLLGLGVMIGLFFFSTFILQVVQSPQLAEYIDPNTLINALPTLVFTAAFTITVLTNFGVLLQALYLSHDMDFLVASPIPMRAVFLAKLLEAILPNFALFCAFSLPVLFGLGTASHFNLLYYPLLLVILALLALASGGMAALLVMGVVRLVPARRVAEILGFLGAIVSIMCGQSGNIMQSLGLRERDFGNALGVLTRFNNPFSPLAWAGGGLIAAGQGRWLTGLGLSLLFLVLAGGIFAFTLLLTERLYYTGWSSMQVSTRRKRARKDATLAAPSMPSGESRLSSPAGTATVAGQAAGRGAQITRWLPQPIRGLVTKDLRLLIRDPRNLSRLITPLILGFVFLFTGRNGFQSSDREIPGGADLSQLNIANLETYSLIFLAVFVGWILVANLGTLSFTREGNNYWLTKIAPLRPTWLLISKFIVSYLPALGFSLVYLLLAFAFRGANWSLFPFSALVIAMCIAGANGIALAFGTAGANLEWDSPNRQRLKGANGCISFPVMMAFLGLDLMLFLLPPVLAQVAHNWLPGFSLPGVVGDLIGLVLGTAGAIAAVWISLRLALPRLALIGEK